MLITIDQLFKAIYNPDSSIAHFKSEEVWYYRFSLPGGAVFWLMYSHDEKALRDLHAHGSLSATMWSTQLLSDGDPEILPVEGVADLLLWLIARLPIAPDELLEKTKDDGEPKK
jgi:hypothetical protein